MHVAHRRLATTPSQQIHARNFVFTFAIVSMRSIFCLFAFKVPSSISVNIQFVGKPYIEDLGERETEREPKISTLAFFGYLYLLLQAFGIRSAYCLCSRCLYRVQDSPIQFQFGFWWIKTLSPAFSVRANWFFRVQNLKSTCINSNVSTRIK